MVVPGMSVHRLATATTEELSRAIEAVEAPVFAVDLNGQVTEWNQMVARMSGWQRQHAIGKPMVETFVMQSHRDAVRTALTSAVGGQGAGSCKFTLFTQDGSRQDILLNASPRYVDGQIIGAVCVGLDVTSSRRSPAPEGKTPSLDCLRMSPVASSSMSSPDASPLKDDCRRLLEKIDMLLFAVDASGRVMDWNRKAAQVTGIPSASAIGKLLIQDCIPAEHRAGIVDAIAKVAQGGELLNFEFPVLTKSGEHALFRASVTSGVASTVGELSGVTFVAHDITDLRQALAERERVAEELAGVVDVVDVPVIVVNTFGHVTRWNRAAADLTGCSEAIGVSLVDALVPPSQRDRVVQVLGAAMEGEKVSSELLPLLSPDGEVHELVVNVSPCRTLAGEVTGAVAIGAPAPVRRTVLGDAEGRAETALSGDIQISAINDFNVPIFCIDIDGFITEWNDNLVEISGWSAEEVVGLPLLGSSCFVPEEDHAEVHSVFSDVQAGVDATNYELPLLTPDGRRLEVLLNATARREANGVVVGAIAIGQDITELNVQRREIERIADDLSRIIETASAPIFGVDCEARITVWNQKVAELSGHKYEEVIDMPLVPNFIPEEYRSTIAFVLLKALGGDKVPNFEITFFSEDGEPHEVIMDAVPRHGPDGEVIGVVAVGHDITDIRQITAEQRQEAEDMARLIRYANAPIIGVDMNCCIMEWNDKIANMTGYPKEEVLGRPLSELTLEESQGTLKEVIDKAKLGVSDPGEFDLELMTKTGDRLILTMSGAAFRDTTGAVAGMVACGQDLTRMRETVLEKTRVAEDLTRIIETANAPILAIDTSGNVTEWNCKAAQITGFSKEEAQGRNLVNTFITKEYREEVGRVLESALTGQETANYEFPLFTKDGRRREILLNATMVRGAGGEVTGVIGVGQDITELRSAMAEQQRIADGLSRLIETANAPIFGVDIHGRVTEWNRKAAQLSGFSKKEAMGRLLVEEFITVEYREKVQSVLERAWQGHEIADFEFPLVSKDGTQVEILLNATPTTTWDGQVTGMVGVGQDITNLRKALEKQKEVADDLTRLIDTANAPIFGIEATGKVTEWNLKAAEISGWGKDETLGRSLVDTFISEPYREEVAQVLQMALEGHESANYEFPLFSKDGRRRDILLNATTCRSADGKVTGVIGVGQDITEMRNLMKQCQSVADDLKRLMETANAPIVGVDTKGCVTVWNRKAASICGYTFDEAVNKPFVDNFIEPARRESVRQVFDRAQGGEVIDDFGLVMYSKTGERRDILFNATPRLGDEGEVIGVIGVGQDITELNQQKCEAVRVAAELQSIVDTASAPIVGIDRLGMVTEWNNRVSQVTGVQKEEALGKSFLSYVQEGSRDETHRVLCDAFEGSAFATFEVLMSTSGEPRVFMLSAAPRLGPEGAIIGVICIGQDITSLRELEVKKSQFAATVTHELRSPLHGIIGLSENILLNPELKPVHRPCQLMNNCARRLLDLVTNIMDISTLVQSKRVSLTRDPVHVAKLVEEVIVMATRTVDKAGKPLLKPEVELINDVNPEKVPIIEADAHRCMQMLYNLVTNALKFTHKGRVKVYAEADDEQESITIYVEDSGIGIAPQNQELIFKPFSQEDQSERRRYEGLGLGLSISREVAVKHGGSLWVKSQVDKGSTFCIQLPYRPLSRRRKQIGRWQSKGSEAHENPENEPESDDEEGSDAIDLDKRSTSDGRVDSGLGLTQEMEDAMNGRVLSVDNGCTAQRAIARLLKSLKNMQVVLCTDIEECMSHLASCGALLPDVVLLDWPAMRPAESTGVGDLRAKYNDRDLPILVLTKSQIGATMLTEFMKHHINDWLQQPASFAELVARLAPLLSRRQNMRAQEEQRPPAIEPPPSRGVEEKLVMRDAEGPPSFCPGHGPEELMWDVAGGPPPGARRTAKALFAGNGGPTLLGSGAPPLLKLEKLESASVLRASLTGWDEALAHLPAEEAHSFLCEVSLALDSLSSPLGVQMQLLNGGDGCVAVSGLSGEADHARRLVEFALLARDRVRELQAQLPAQVAGQVCISFGVDSGALCRGPLGSIGAGIAASPFPPQQPSEEAVDDNVIVSSPTALFGGAAAGARHLCEFATDHPGSLFISHSTLNALSPDLDGWLPVALFPGHPRLRFSRLGTAVIVGRETEVGVVLREGEVLPLQMAMASTTAGGSLPSSARGFRFARLGNAQDEDLRSSDTPRRMGGFGGDGGEWHAGGEGPPTPVYTQMRLEDQQHAFLLNMQNAHLRLEVRQFSRRVATLEAQCRRLALRLEASETVLLSSGLAPLEQRQRLLSFDADSVLFKSPAYGLAPQWDAPRVL